MPDQPENDESLPSPTPDETARLTREGSHSKVSVWKRLLTPWAVSIGLHLFVVPFALVVTVAFADQLFVPTVWENDPTENLGPAPYSLVIEDRDFPVKQVQEKLIPLDKEGEREVKEISGDALWRERPEGEEQEPIPPPVGKPQPPVQRKPPQVGSDGNFVIEQPTESAADTGRWPDVIFAPTPQRLVDRMLQIAKIRPGEVVFDLGCGDGRIPITAAKKFGAWGFGYDIDPERVKQSVENAKKQGLTNQVVFERRDIFKLDLSQADVITLYLLPRMNVELIPQLEKMKPGSGIVSHDFDMEGIEPDLVQEIRVADEWLGKSSRTHKIYLWTLPLKKSKQ